MHVPFADILKTALVCAVLIALTLLWVHKSRQQKVCRSWRNSLLIASRIALVHAMVIVIFIGLLGVPFIALFIALPFVLVLLVVSRLEPYGVGAGGIEELALYMAIAVPPYVLKQFILGFPDRDQFQLEPPPPQPIPNSVPDVSELRSTTGTVVATLRPMGKIKIDDREYPAASEDGNFIDVGAVVQVRGRRESLLLVAPSGPAAAL